MDTKKISAASPQARDRMSDDLRTISTRVCHDLFSPTNTVRMCLTLLKDESNNGVVSRSDLLETANDAVDELIELVEKMRFVTEASTARATFEWVDMENCFMQSVQALGTVGQDALGRLKAPESWPRVYGVSLWIREIFSIFLKNALVHAGGEADITVTWERRGDALRFNVVDTGVGVAEPLRNSLFRPFDQLHRFNDGRGLSLSIAERLARLQKGRCGYESTGAFGSRFYFELPQGPVVDEIVESEQ